MWTTIGNKIYYPSNVTFPLKPKYYDIADSIVIAKAGYEICQSRKK